MKYFKTFTLVLSAALLGFAHVQAKPLKLPAPEPLKFNLPEPVVERLDNGLTIYMLEDHSLPLVRAFMLIDSGSLYDPKGKTGLSDFAMEALREGGTYKYTPAEMNAELERLGARIETDSAYEYTSISMRSLAEDVPAVMDIFADMIKAPAFNPEKVTIVRQGFMEGLKRRNDDAAAMVSREGRRKFYGADHPLGIREEPETINAIAIADLKGFHSKYFKPNNAVLAVAGNFKAHEMLSLIRSELSDWKPGGVVKAQVPPVTADETGKVFVINKTVENAPVLILGPGPDRQNEDLIKHKVLNSVLSGSMGARLTVEVRTKRGLAYSVYSYLSPSTPKGMFITGLGTKNNTVSEATSEALRQIDLLKIETVSQEELNRAKSSLIDSFIFNFQTPYDILVEVITYRHLGYPEDYFATYTQKVSEVTAEDVKAAAKKWFTDEGRFIIMAVDPAKTTGSFADLGEITELKAD